MSKTENASNKVRSLFPVTDIEWVEWFANGHIENNMDSDLPFRVTDKGFDHVLQLILEARNEQAQSTRN